MHDLVSVIVPTRNAMPYLPEALASIIAQGYPHLEILVVDGASTDGSRNVALSFPQVRLIEQAGIGLAAARNSGLAAASGDLIAFLDADDHWPTDSLATRIASLHTHPDAPYISGHVQRFAEPGTPVPAAYANGWLDQPVPGYTPGAVVVRRSLYEAVGPFDEQLRIGCDSDWFARAKDVGAVLRFVPQLVLHKRIHTRNLSASIAAYQRELLTIARRSLQRRGVIGA
ncbi:glycosyltransferase [Candidatus Chloroploca sp. Khr17]|uniref:glycosyltransferase n=1 Tax=Candidatus Chloroploca sp. Khr17 TaxID=2496869 RepID=UPI00101B65DF|nr:glycosyltransferase [Candidatus Chloroploca sp. Khr17]